MPDPRIPPPPQGRGRHNSVVKSQSVASESSRSSPAPLWIPGNIGQPSCGPLHILAQLPPDMGPRLFVVAVAPAEYLRYHAAYRIALLPADAHVHLAAFSCLAAGALYCLASSLRIFSRAPRMASVTSLVVAEPFRSGVRTSVSPSTCSMAETTPAPASSCPRLSSIIAPDQIWPMGFAIPCPAMSGAEPWTGSNIEGYSPSGFRLAEGAIPMLPATAAPRSLRMSPKRFEPTTTSRLAGLSTNAAARASM